VVQHAFVLLACGIGGGDVADATTSSHATTATATSDQALVMANKLFCVLHVACAVCC
jgi:hypothetical protein